MSELFHDPNYTPELLDTLADKLMNEYLWLSDEHRNQGYVWSLLNKLFSGDQTLGINCPFEMGDGDAMIIFTDIIPNFRCGVMLKLINQGSFSKTAVREARVLFDMVMDVFNLKRIGSRTADYRVAKLGRLVGMEDEGVEKSAFMWDEKPYDVYILGKVRGG